MEPSTSDTYEQQLYAVFKTADVNHTGTLDSEGLTTLCATLQLDELGTKLIKSLNSKKHITFYEFKEALIKLLREDNSEESDSSPKSKYPKKPNRRSKSDTNAEVHPLKKRKQLKRCTSDTGTYEDTSILKFITMTPEGSGIIDAEVIVEIWEQAGISSPQTLLQDLGFNQSEINIVELANIIEEELQNISNQIFSTNPHLALLQASRVLYQSEVRCLKSVMEHLNAERDKLRSDINEANLRSEFLTQEVDDNHAKIEKATNEKVKLLEQRHANIVRDLTEQLTGEREQVSLLNLKLEQRTSGLENEVTKLKIEIERMEQDALAIENENHSLLEQVSELQQNNTILSLNVSSLENEKVQLCELETKRERDALLTYEEQITSLQLENMSLKDKNDELCMELESISSQLSKIKTSPEKVKHRSIKLMPYSGNSDEDYELTDTSIQSTASTPDEDFGRLQARVAYLEKLVAGYGHDVTTDPNLLDSCQVTDKQSTSPQKPSSESLKERYKQLELILHDIKMGLEKATDENTDKSFVTELQQKLIENVEFIRNLTDTPAKPNETSEIERLTKENKVLESRCADLEQSLELLRNEYDRCEDYWSNKLDEERQFFDQDKKQSDQKFQELLNKMTELGDQFAVEDGNKLPVIAEDCNETEFLELQEEYDNYKRMVEEELEKQQAEITKLKAKPETADAETQAESIESKQTQHTSVHRTRKFSAGDVSYRKDEVKRLRNVKSQLDEEIKTLQQQKAGLVKDCTDLQNKASELEEPIVTLKWKGLRGITNAGKVCRISVNTLQDLNGKMHQLDQRCKHLQQVLRKHQQQSESMLHQSWVQHKNEIAELQYIINATKTEAEIQSIKANEMIEKLKRSDHLVKELYVENSYLIANNQHLQHHCHKLSKLRNQIV